MFFERYMERLFAYAVGFTRNREDAEDVVQEAFIHLWMNRGRVERVAALQGYLFRSVRNACIDRWLHARVERRYRQEMTALHRETRPEEDDPEALVERLQAALATLPPRCREFFVMGCVEGMSYREIAEAAGVSENTVKTQIKIAYKKLREELGEEEALALLVMLCACPA